MIPAMTGLGGLILTIITLALAEYRRTRRAAVQMEAIQRASSTLAYEKLRLELIKAAKDNVPAIETDRALSALRSADQITGRADLASDVEWPKIRKKIAFLPLTYSLALIAVSLYGLVRGWGVAPSLTGMVIGLALIGYFSLWVVDWLSIIKPSFPKSGVPGGSA